MPRVKTGVLLLALLCGSASTTMAQFPNYAYLKGQYDGNALQLEIRVLRNQDIGTAVALDVYRGTLGLSACGPEVRITNEPIPWPSAPFPASVTLADDGVAPATTYWYRLRPVDAQRNAAAISSSFLATTGVALLSHAYVYFDMYGSPNGYWAQPCPQECVADGLLQTPLPAELIPYVDTSTYLLLYGEVVGVVSGYNSFWPLLRIDHAQPSMCLVAVAPAPWSSVKRLYR